MLINLEPLQHCTDLIERDNMQCLFYSSYKCDSILFCCIIISDEHVYLITTFYTVPNMRL